MAMTIRHYTPEEDELIRQEYPLQGGVKLAARMDRTPASIVARANKLGVEYIGPLGGKGKTRGEYMPTLEEIERDKRLIREGKL